ncbi:MAG: hypothetical protein JOZ24_04465 [Candidatus Eremiobacteraeota bacterium]|nr:hypothetical protein [Candidatus Eremiobacteraeota bacterium]
MDLRRRSIMAVVCVITLLAATRPSLALPGQTLQQFRTWSAGRKLLAGIAPKNDELSGKRAFALMTADHGIAWRFYASSNGATIQRELLSVSQPGKEPGTEPIRHSGEGYGFQFFTAVYGNGIAADFHSARIVGSVKDPTNGQVTRYYVGARYGYAETRSVTVETLSQLKQDMALAKRCAASPQSCSE